MSTYLRAIDSRLDSYRTLLRLLFLFLDYLFGSCSFDLDDY